MNHSDSPASTDSSSAEVPGARPATVRLADLIGDMIWPRLLQTARIAARPRQIGLGLFTLVLMAILASPVHLWDSDARDFASVFLEGEQAGLALALEGLATGQGSLLGTGLRIMMFEAPIQTLTEHPWQTIFLTPLVLLVLVIGGGAISRIAACEFSLGVDLRWEEALSFSITRARSSLGALLIPVLLIGVIGLLIGVGGWVLLGPSWLRWLGGALYVLALLGGGLLTLLLVGFVLASPMLIPAIVCEGADAFDAIQRAFAYLFGHPLRYFIFAGIVELTALAALGVAGLVASGIVEITATTTAMFLSDETAAVVHSGTALAVADAETGGANATSMIAFWSKLPWLLVSAYGLSLFFTGYTLVYLAQRRVCDGQEMDDLWMPGMIEGTMAHALAGRASVASEVVTPPSDADDAGRERIQRQPGGDD